MANKKYYWLKLKDDFFKTREIKKLRKIAGGDTYTIIYLKMQLLSIKREGIIVYEGTEDDLAEQLALELDEEQDNVKMTLAFLQANNLIEQLTRDEYLLNRVPASLGSETGAAERMRTMREKRNNVTQDRNNVQKCYTEIEIEKEKEIEKEIEDYIQPAPAEPTPQETARQSIFDHWNEQGIIKHRTLTDKLKRTINGALRDYSIDEIKQAISNYAAILEGKQYYFSHKWTLKHFLERGFEQFLDWETCVQNYARGDPLVKDALRDTCEDLDNKYADIYMT